MRTLLFPISILGLCTAALAGTPPAGPITESPVADKAASLRCAAAFGIVAAEQSRGVKSAKAWPDLRKRGKEFFVQLGARIMDEEGLDRLAMQARYKAEIDRLQNEAIDSPDPAATVRGVMEPCLQLLNATVPAGKR